MLMLASLASESTSQAGSIRGVNLLRDLIAWALLGAMTGVAKANSSASKPGSGGCGSWWLITIQSGQASWQLFWSEDVEGGKHGFSVIPLSVGCLTAWKKQEGDSTQSKDRDTLCKQCLMTQRESFRVPITENPVRDLLSSVTGRLKQVWDGA